MNLLLVNAGSSSLKVSVNSIDGETELVAASVDWSGDSPHYRFVSGGAKASAGTDSRQLLSGGHGPALKKILADLKERSPDMFGIGAIGHRVVHGGDRTSGVIITDKIVSELAELSTLAPLHNPPSLAAIGVAREELSGLPHVALFDTAFHRAMPPEAAHYAIPDEWSSRLRIKRYGFHGLSHSYSSARAAEMLSRPPDQLRLIICHLGHGCSASAVRGGRCLDTTMGFTPLEGLMMATRSGSIDAGAVLYLHQHQGISADEIASALNSRSGLLGVSGVSADMREVLAAADDGNERARVAISMFCYRVRQTIGAYVATLGGADALIFTAGIGENSARIREQIAAGLEVLGFSLDADRNNNDRPDCIISAEDSGAKIFVIKAREELSMIREMRTVLGL